MWWPLVLVQEACLGEKSASVLSFERIFPYSMLSWSEDLHQGAQQRGKNAGIGAQQADAWFGSFCGRVRVVKVVMVAEVVHTSLYCVLPFQSHTGAIQKSLKMQWLEEHNVKLVPSRNGGERSNFMESAKQHAST